MPAAHIKHQVDHWRVYEDLGFEFSGSGEHLYFYIEKTNLNTADVARMLAQAHGVARHQVGYAGLKDKYAVTRQWFSLTTNSDAWLLDEDNVTCLDIQRHTRKLRRGDHRANRFEICLSDCDPAVYTLAASMHEVFPNYFGPQRVSPTNVSQALEWLANSGLGPGCRETAPTRRGKSRRQRGGRRSERQGWHMSVLRSFLFNAVLDQRVAGGSYAQVIDGDVVVAGQPTGPLWGRGRSATSGLAAQIEQQALAPYAQTCDALEFVGVSQARRTFAVVPEGFSATHDKDLVTMKFTLPPGAYATALLGHKLEITDDSKRYE